MNFQDILEKGGLILIPTPIDEETPLEPVASSLLMDAFTGEDPKNVPLVETLKAARARWIRWGLPRQTLDRFRVLDEQSTQETYLALVDQLKRGSRVFLMSDAGLPAFCDPGQPLVDLCHRHGIKVRATPFPHSTALAVALSGFPCASYYFKGFLPQKTEQRKAALLQMRLLHEPIVLMDTPYRYRTLVGELAELLPDRILFCAENLNCPEERLLRGFPKDILDSITKKAEVVVVVGPQGFR